jgi:hypothetical protein
MFTASAKQVLPALAVLVSVLLLTGCGPRSEVIESLDPSSAQILIGVPPGMNVVLACKLDPLPTTLELPAGGREIARSGNTVLFEVPRDNVEELKGFGDAVTMAVWGGTAHIKKMDHQLQSLLLESADSQKESEYSVMARFTPGTENIGELLEAAGVQSRTTAGIVVTITSDAEGIFRMLQIKELEILKNPRQLSPTN